jgi:Lar family restriction alleviation protein
MRGMPKDLLPCPFCGSKDVELIDTFYDSAATFWFVKCGRCDAQGPSFTDRSAEPGPAAESAWNQRP